MEQPSNGEFGLGYQIYVLRQMINQLPTDISNTIISQIDIIEGMVKHRQMVIKSILPQLEDVMLNVRYIEFDRNATANERDNAIKKYLGD